MNNFVIVEDKLKRGISLAEQLTELSQAHPELEILVTAVCYFHPNEASANKDIKECGEHDFTIIPVSLWNFDEVLDRYMDQQNEHAIIIMDFLLDNDGSNGIPIRRVNIKYARRADEEKRRRILFYTATSTALQETLCELVGRENVLEVKDVGVNILHLNLEEEAFRRVLEKPDLAGA